MTPSTVNEIFRQTLMTVFWISFPLLTIGVISSIVVGLVQIVTSLQDSTVATVPRLFVFLGAIIVLMPWMTQRMLSYTTSILGDLGRYAR